MPKITPRQQIKEGAKTLKQLMIAKLGVIIENMIAQMMRSYRTTIPSQRLSAIKDIQPTGIADYKATLIEALSALANDAIEQARKEVPKASKVKLAEFDQLTPELQKILKTRTELLVGKQVADIKSVLDFAYTGNLLTTDSEAILTADIEGAAEDFLTCASVTAGAEITASTVIADARDAFFFDSDVLEEIDAFEFVNEDPQTPICIDLAGTIFDKNDPELFRYTPPLHWGCKSWIRPILKGELGDREVTDLRPSTSKLEASIQFSEEVAMHCASKNCC